jgi:hypothetical protein
MSDFLARLLDERSAVFKRIKELDAQANSGHPGSLDAIRKQLYLGGYLDGLDDVLMWYKIETGWVMD